MDLMDLTNKIAVVTGGTKGIGRAIADALLAQGVSVCVSARHVDVIGRSSRSDGRREITFPCDVRNYEHVKGLIGYTVKEFGGLDILINNAGIGTFHTTVDEMCQCRRC